MRYLKFLLYNWKIACNVGIFLGRVKAAYLSFVILWKGERESASTNPGPWDRCYSWVPLFSPHLLDLIQHQDGSYASNSALEKKVIKLIVQLPATYDTQHNPKHLTFQPFCSFYFQERSVIVRQVQCKELDLYQRNEKDVSTTVHNWTLRKNVTSLVLFYKRIVLNLVHFKNIAKIIIWWSKI